MNNLLSSIPNYRNISLQLSSSATKIKSEYLSMNEAIRRIVLDLDHNFAPYEFNALFDKELTGSDYTSN